MDIRIVPRDEIDKIKWNSCVHYANNGNIFGYIWYLDHVAKDWDGLVEGDYESVFPLVYRSNIFKTKELYQPDLMRELGIYSINVLSQARIQAFLDAIPAAYKKVDIILNEQNALPKNGTFQVEEKKNYQLLLSRPYEEIADEYEDSLLRILEKAHQIGYVPSSGLKPEKIAEFFKKHTLIKKNLDQQFHTLQRVMYNVLHRGWGFASGVLDAQAKLQAVNFFIYSHGKVLSLVPVASPEGRENGAVEYSYDLLIRTHAQRLLLLDFNVTDDSKIPKQFGAVETPFYRVKRDNRTFGLF